MGIRVSGTNGEFTVDANAAFNNVTAGAFTLCMWHKVDVSSWPADDTSRLSDKDATTGGFSWIIQRMTGVSSGLCRYRFIQLTNTVDGDWATTANVASWGTAAPWQFAAITRNGASHANLPTFYHNGLPVATTTLVTPTGTILSDAAENMRIGNATTLVRPINGVLALYQVYNRILSADEIVNKYTTRGSDNNRFGLVCELQMDEDSPGTVATQSKHRETSATQATFGAINTTVTYDSDEIRKPLGRRRRAG